MTSIALHINLMIINLILMWQFGRNSWGPSSASILSDLLPIYENGLSESSTSSANKFYSGQQSSVMLGMWNIGVGVTHLRL